MFVKEPFSRHQVDLYLKMACSKETKSLTDSYLYQALDTFPLTGKKVAIFHSTSPWYESIALAYGAQPSTVRSSIAFTEDKRLTIESNPKEHSFDAVWMLLHLKKLGLGPSIHLDADLEEMHEAKRLLKNSGLLYLSLPVGKDRIFSHSHRIYGAIRMKLLFKGWRPAGYFGYSYEDLLKEPDILHEPIFVLKPLYNEENKKITN